QDDGGGGRKHRRMEHLARVNDRGIQASDRDRLETNCLVTRVEQQYEKVLAFLPAQASADESHDVVGTTDCLGHLPTILPFRQFADVHTSLQRGADIKKGSQSESTRSPG